jgi:predicted transcriptional regulator
LYITFTDKRADRTMTTQITITLPDEVYQRAERFARLANRDIASVLADTIQLSMPLIGAGSLDLMPVSELTDEQVLALTALQMEPSQDARLSELLDRQQAGLLTDGERIELQVLMQIYQEGLLRKATALSESVKRGLIEPLEP